VDGFNSKREVKVTDFADKQKTGSRNVATCNLNLRNNNRSHDRCDLELSIPPLPSNSKPEPNRTCAAHQAEGQHTGHFRFAFEIS
jgi:hypothetical protein